MSDADIQLLPEGTGPHVRTVSLTSPDTVNASGNAQADVTRHQQLVTLADRRGETGSVYEQELLGLLRSIDEHLVAILQEVS